MLEQIAYETAPRLQTPQSQSTYQVNYLESLSATALYSGEPVNPRNVGIGGNMAPSEKSKIGEYSEFQKEGPNNISMEHDLGSFAPEAKGYNLNERYDASGHDNSFVHLNQDIIDKVKNEAINSGKSKKNSDGWKGLGPAHNTPLPGGSDD